MTLLQAGTPTGTSGGILGEFLASRPEQYVATLLLALAFLATTALVYRLGDNLKSEMESESAEAVQAIVVTALGVVSGVLLVLVWRATRWVGEALATIEPSPTDGVKVLITVLAFGIAYTGTRITKRFIRFGEGRNAITNHQREILHHVLQLVVYLPAIAFTVAIWGVPAEDLFLSASVLGVVLGLAARQTLGAVLAGFVLLFSRPFEVGDWVEIDDNEGIVTDISIVNTQLQTFDDELVMIPNDQITDEAVVNRSRNDRLRVQVDVGVDYETDVAHAMSVAAEAMDGIDMLMDGPEPDVVVERFGDSAVVLNLRFWIEHPTIQRKWAAQNRVMEAVKEAFEEEGIAIPFPQRVLSGREQAGGLQVTGGAVDAAADGAEEEPEAAVEASADGNGEGSA
ncbi:mechanosensitive ion channel family protein [Halorarius litoreus]|uniref:mechanosensitive ion channel family protein n=1 Tax=Halorarius litoreus TaxID=2962676 RepID=UPI0020CF5207|nr:mechanosensitive ion channel family protein [Halorarius litoreus]